MARVLVSPSSGERLNPSTAKCVTLRERDCRREIVVAVLRRAAPRSGRGSRARRRRPRRARQNVADAAARGALAPAGREPRGRLYARARPVDDVRQGPDAASRGACWASAKSAT